ncbi:MAG: baseplate J/gp47 family protein, partial [Lachnospirales bacterium]
MFEEMTFENILKSALSKVSSDVDKRQGSIIYDAIAPACAELAQAYIQMDLILENSFADTAIREYLILRAKERGIEPYEATRAVLKGVFNCDVPVGSRFSLDGLYYTVFEKISDYEYRVGCETYGTEGNNHLGRLLPLETIEGLETANLTELLIA